MAMRKPSLAVVPVTRTPERQALADAIAERNRRLKLVADKRAELEAESDRGASGYTRRDELEEQLRRVMGQAGDAARRDALLRGETPDDADRAEPIRAEIAAIDAAREKSHALQHTLKADVALLQGTLASSDWQIERARRAVIDTDPAVVALVAALQAAVTRARLLRMVLSDVGVTVDEPPFPSPSPAWANLYERLARDPDAAIPGPEEI